VVIEPVRLFTQPQGAKEITWCIDRFTADFGSLEMIPTTELPPIGGTPVGVNHYPHMLIYDPEVLYWLPLEGLYTKTLPENVGGKVTVIRGSGYLQVLSPLRLGAITWRNA
jgi:hypothetical protein